MGRGCGGGRRLEFLGRKVRPSVGNHRRAFLLVASVGQMISERITPTTLAVSFKHALIDKCPAFLIDLLLITGSALDDFRKIKLGHSWTLHHMRHNQTLQFILSPLVRSKPLL